MPGRECWPSLRSHVREHRHHHRRERVDGATTVSVSVIVVAVATVIVIAVTGRRESARSAVGAERTVRAQSTAISRRVAVTRSAIQSPEAILEIFLRVQQMLCGDMVATATRTLVWP